MKKGSVIFLKAVILIFGFVALAIMLWEPHLEGRNADATLVQIYFHDPFLAYAYLASIPFFVALFQAFKLLGYIGKDRVFSPGSVKALRAIKYCATALVFLIALPEVYLLAVRPEDDIAGGVMMGVAMIFVSSVVAIAASVFEKLLQSAVDMKSENDLTI